MYKKIILVICLLFTTQAVAKKQALLVGVSDYGGNPRNDLPGINLDIEKMSKLFVSWGFEIKVLRDSESLQIGNYLQNYGANLNSNDTFAFYYSGHGSFVPDRNGDEPNDHRDETLVLSDGVRNIPFVDDELNYYLNAISAKKLVIFDSCHSGTAHRGESGEMRAKTLPTSELSSVVGKGLRVGREIDSGKYVILSASKDIEQSIATYGGSLFTNEIYRLFSSHSSKSFESVREEATYNIVNRCKQGRQKPHHPQFSFSDASFKDISIDGYLKTITRPQPSYVAVPQSSLQTKLENMVKNAGQNQITIGNKRETYRTNDFVNFTLNTNGQRGYLSILYVDNSDVTVLYPNPKLTSQPIQGEYSFPRDFGNFKIRAFKNCNGCVKDKTDIYLLLTSQPLANIERLSRNKMLIFSKGSDMARLVSKDVEVIEDTPPKQSGGRFMIGKYGFFVE